MTFSSPTVLAEARKLRASPRDACSLNFSSSWRRSFISFICCSKRFSSSPGLVLNIWAMWNSTCWLRLMVSSVSWPTVASIRRTPEATDASLLMRKGPTLAVLSTWVPPQNSMDTPPISTTRTTSLYFSPNMATAPFFLASSMGSTSVTTGMPSRMASLTSLSTCASCSGVMASKWVKSNRRRSGSTREPA